MEHGATGLKNFDAHAIEKALEKLIALYMVECLGIESGRRLPLSFTVLVREDMVTLNKIELYLFEREQCFKHFPKTMTL